MEITGWIGGVYKVSRWITNLAYINILWIVFTLIGMVFFGFFPATAAMFTVVRKWVTGDTNIPVFKTFWHSYRTEFWKINCLGFILSLFGFILYLDLTIFPNGEHFIYMVHRIGLFVISLIFGIFCMFFFPVYVHFDLKLFQYYKQIFLIIFLVPLSSLGMILAAIAQYIVLFKLPGLMPFFSGSILSFAWMWIAYKAFLYLQKTKNEKLNKLG